MAIRDWTDDFISGHAEVDEQHKTLFKMINDFAGNEDKSDDSVQAFLAALGEYCVYHFGLEQQMMKDNDYPLQDYHRDIHGNLFQTVKDVKGKIEQNEIEEAYTLVLDFATDWLNNHIANHDLTFISFNKHKDEELDGRFTGRKCSILSMSNNELGNGVVKSVDKTKVVITTESDMTSIVKLNDMVKINTVSGQNEPEVFIAKIYDTSFDEIMLFDAIVSEVIKDRAHFRVSTDIRAVILLDHDAFDVVVEDVSSGGMGIKTYLELSQGDTVEVEFIVQNNFLTVPCKVMRVEKNGGDQVSYGLMFLPMEKEDAEKVNSFVFNRQIL